MVADALIRYGQTSADVSAGNHKTDADMKKQVHELFRDKFEMLEKQSS